MRPEVATEVREWLERAADDLREAEHDLTPYAWRFRYPGTPLAPTEDETYQALTLARAVYEAVIARLPEEVWP